MPRPCSAALAGTKFEVVFDNVYDWERGTTAGQVEATVRAAGDNIKRYVFMSSVAAYGDGLNHHEGDALAPDDAPELYVRNKAMSERALFRLHQRIGLPGGHAAAAVSFTGRESVSIAKRSSGIACAPDRVHHPARRRPPPDAVRLRQGSGDGRAARDGRAGRRRATPSTSPIRAPISQTEAVEAFAKACRKQAKFVRIPREYILRAGGHPMGPKLYFGVYFDMPPITLVTGQGAARAEIQTHRFRSPA